jgi:acyl dehydratase
MNERPNRPVWVFDDFHSGQQLGRLSIALDDEHLAHWAAIYGAPPDAECVPSGVLVAAMMEAYVKGIQPRPPGNIHAGQKLTFGKPVRVGDQLDAQVTCLWKERRKDRNWIGFGVTLRADGRDALNGEIRSIWSR